jgi:hypothetical protein
MANPAPQSKVFFQSLLQAGSFKEGASPIELMPTPALLSLAPMEKIVGLQWEKRRGEFILKIR